MSQARTNFAMTGFAAFIAPPDVHAKIEANKPKIAPGKPASLSDLSTLNRILNNLPGYQFLAPLLLAFADAALCREKSNAIDSSQTVVGEVKVSLDEQSKIWINLAYATILSDLFDTTGEFRAKIKDEIDSFELTKFTEEQIKRAFFSSYLEMIGNHVFGLAADNRFEKNTQYHMFLSATALRKNKIDTQGTFDVVKLRDKLHNKLKKAIEDRNIISNDLKNQINRLLICFDLEKRFFVIKNYLDPKNDLIDQLESARYKSFGSVEAGAAVEDFSIRFKFFLAYKKLFSHINNANGTHNEKYAVLNEIAAIYNTTKCKTKTEEYKKIRLLTDVLEETAQDTINTENYTNLIKEVGKYDWGKLLTHRMTKFVAPLFFVGCLTLTILTAGAALPVLIGALSAAMLGAIAVGSCAGSAYSYFQLKHEHAKEAMKNARDSGKNEVDDTVFSEPISIALSK